MFLLSVFILAYGVAIQAVIDPYRELTWDKFSDVLFQIFFMPYWQMYGELSLEEIEVTVPNCITNTPTFNSTNITQSSNISNISNEMVSQSL